VDLAIITESLASYGGSEIYLLECMRRWQEHARITVYAAQFRWGLLAEFGLDPTRVEVVRLPMPTPGENNLLSSRIVAPLLWERAIRRHDAYLLYLVPTQLIRRRPSVWFAAEPLRILYDLRENFAETGEGGTVPVHLYPRLDYDRVERHQIEVELDLVERLSASATFDKMATNSHATGRYLELVHGRAADLVAYPGVRRREVVIPPSSERRALVIGRLWRHKRVELSVRAMAHAESGELVIVGKGPEKSNLERLAWELGVSDRVHFRGAVSATELDQLQDESTLCVYTPVQEPFGMVPLEAAAASRPVVATRGGGFSEILDESCARYISACPAEIGDAMSELFENPELAQSMGMAGRERVDPWTWDRTASSIFELLTEVAEPRSRATASRSATTRPLLGAHYYPWFKAGATTEHWGESAEFAGLTDFPASGPYTSTDPATIERHLDEASRAELDFLVVNLQVPDAGLRPTELEATRSLYSRVEARGDGLRLVILLAVETEEAAVTEGALRLVHEEFLSRPASLRHEGEPVLFLFLSDAFRGYFYSRHDTLASLTRGTRRVATGGILNGRYQPEPVRRYFHGWCPYSPLQIGPFRRRADRCTGAYRDWVEDKGDQALRVYTICPGYDDAHLESQPRANAPIRSVERQGTRTYEDMQREALSLEPAPHLIVVTSFNEFHENTHIEPSRTHGDAFLRSTAAFKHQLVKIHPSRS